MRIARTTMEAWAARIAPDYPELDMGNVWNVADWTPGEVGAFRCLAEDDFYWFTVFVLGYTRLGPPGGFHEGFCSLLSTPAQKAQLFMYYRAAFKSTIGGIAYPLWQFAVDVANYSHLKLVADIDLGKQHSAAMRRQVDQNPRLKRLFPELTPSKSDWSDAKFSFGNRDFSKTGSSMEVRTMKQGHAGRHVTEISMDDIVNEDNYSSRGEQQRLKDRLELMWPTIDTDRVFMYGTRYADYDFWGHVIEQLWPEDLEVHIQPVRGTAVLDADGEVVLTDTGVYAHPEEWDDERLAATERKMVRKDNKDPYVFMCQYFLDTKHRIDQHFKKEWLRWIMKSEIEKPLTYYIGVDSASGKGTSFPAMAVVGLDEDRHVYIMEARSDFETEADLVDAVFEANLIYRPACVAVERYAQGGYATQTTLEDQCVARGQWPPFEWVTHGLSDKEAHIRETLRPQYLWGNITHLMDLKDGTFENELTDFPRGAHEDTLDATAYAVQWGLKLGPYHRSDAGEQKKTTLMRRRVNDKIAFSEESLAIPLHPDDELEREEASYAVI